VKVLEVFGETVRLQLWDIAGQEQFGSMTRVYFKNAVGAIVVCDLSEEKPLHHVGNWKADLDAKTALKDG
jgi:GTPase SAR1 family protein